MGDHDWNDGLSAVGTLLKGESFWVAEFLYMILGSFGPLAEQRGDTRFADKCQVIRHSLQNALNCHGWDGAWYLQATTDDGLLLGASANDEGKIFLMPNAWAVISGAAAPDRAKKAMDSVTEYLLKEYMQVNLEGQPISDLKKEMPAIYAQFEEIAARNLPRCCRGARRRQSKK